MLLSSSVKPGFLRFVLAQVMEILLRLAHEEGRCVIVVTHDMDIAAQADEVWRMKDGALALEA